MRDFGIACRHATDEARQYPATQLMTETIRVYYASPAPLVYIVFESFNETTWANLDCVIAAIKRFMRRW